MEEGVGERKDGRWGDGKLEMGDRDEGGYV